MRVKLIHTPPGHRLPVTRITCESNDVAIIHHSYLKDKEVVIVGKPNPEKNVFVRRKIFNEVDTVSGKTSIIVSSNGLSVAIKSGIKSNESNNCQSGKLYQQR